MQIYRKCNDINFAKLRHRYINIKFSVPFEFLKIQTSKILICWSHIELDAQAHICNPQDQDFEFAANFSGQSSKSDFEFEADFSFILQFRLVLPEDSKTLGILPLHQPLHDRNRCLDRKQWHDCNLQKLAKFVFIFSILRT